MGIKGKAFGRTQEQSLQHMQERMEGQEVANRGLVRMNPEDEIKM